jgi:hypothetical protein
MTPRSGSVFHILHLGMVRAASLLAPSSQRAEWLREWRSELWHVRNARAPRRNVSWRAERELTHFCLGAFRDALCLRRHAPVRERRTEDTPASPVQCILGLALVLTASYTLSLLLPGVRAANEAARGQIDPGLILIEHPASIPHSTATVSASEFASWRARRQRYFDRFAFYSVARESVTTADGNSQWTVAHATANLFSLLGVPLRFSVAGAGADDSPAGAILSCEAFEREFDADPRIAGSVVRVGRRLARIAGVAPCGAWPLPGKADLWFLEPESAVSPGAMGYVVAHLTALGRAEIFGPSVSITAYGAHDSAIDLLGVALEDHSRAPFDIYRFALLLALLCLPAVTSVSMGEYSFNSHKPSRSRRLCRWSFLCAKIALLLLIVYYVPLDLAWWHISASSFASDYTQLIASFLLCLFGMRWVLLDQRKRCPVCLRCVTHPAQVGLASRMFLSWNGTELICMGGHTLLHVPGLPTSWFSAQRWLYLDASWDFLFAGSSQPGKS